MNFKDECIEVNNHPIIVLKDPKNSKCEVRIFNHEKYKVSKIIVDDCQIVEGKRCDYMIIDKDIEHYFEMKDSKISRALDQIESTINKVSEDKKTIEKKAYVITTKGPKFTSIVQNKKLKFVNKYNCSIKVATRNLEIKI
jgi:hypothetical protein